MTCCCNLIETLRSTPPSSTSVDDETPWINRLLFRPPPFSCYAFPNVVTLTTSRGSQICAVSLIRPGAAVTLLVSHANAEDLNGVYPTLVKLAVLLNVNVVGYDYSGYGGSTGTPSEANCYADIDRVHSYLVNERGIPPERIALFGRSLGSGPSCYLAQKLCQQDRSAAALILHAPFASVFRVVLPRWCCGAAAPAPARSWSLIGDKFCNVDRMRDITCPVLIAHGQKDAIVPFWHGMALLKQRRRAVAADSSSSSSATASTAVSSAPATCPSEAELFTTPGMHHNYWETKSDEEKFVGALNAFLDNHISVRQRWWTSKQT